MIWSIQILSIDYTCLIFSQALSQSFATMWDAETFPWLVAVGFLDGEDGLPKLLCSAAAVSKFVVVAPAHCISGLQKSRILISSNNYR